MTWTRTDSGLAWTLTAKAYTSQGQQTDIRLATFKSYGYKSSSAYCDNLFSTNEVTFLCETWLTVAECQQVKKSLGNTHWSSLKSSMDTTSLHVGRPYGGVGFICRKNKDISYTEIDLQHDRLHCVKLYNGTNTLMYVIGVYMPFNLEISFRNRFCSLHTSEASQSNMVQNKANEDTQCFIV